MASNEQENKEGEVGILLLMWFLDWIVDGVDGVSKTGEVKRGQKIQD